MWANKSNRDPVTNKNDLAKFYSIKREYPVAIQVHFQTFRKISQTTLSIMKNINILTFIAFIQQTFAVVPIQNRLSLPNLKFLEDDAGCELKPQNAATLDNKMARIIDTKYGDGIIATQIYNAVRHGRCQNESPSICNWVFGHCGQSSIYNQTLNDVFSVQSEFYKTGLKIRYFF